MNKTGTLVIAEAGDNHNGSFEMAIQLIDAAVEVRADVVKFQTFRSEQVISRHARKAEYQLQVTEQEESQLDMIKKLELTFEQHQQLMQYCEKSGIEYMTSVFDLESAEFIARAEGVKRIKIASGEITNPPLLFRTAVSGKPVILATGMGTIGEVETALAILALGYTNPSGKPTLGAARASFRSEQGQQALREKVTLLHCTTDYPARFEDVNLRAMDTLRQAFGLPVGLSDHTKGIVAPVAAVARGAIAIEKHFTLDCTLPGPDHQASLEPDELAAMVRAIRDVEKALGTGIKLPTDAELINLPIIRKSLVASRPIKTGEKYTADNITVKRPDTGVSSIHYWDYLGRTAGRDYLEDEEIG